MAERPLRLGIIGIGMGASFVLHGADRTDAVVSGERGDLRQSPHGVYVYDDDGLRELRVDIAGRQSGELLEIYNAVRLGKPVYHSGEWGMATLEVIMAINESAKTHKDVLLTHQVEMPAGYDEDYPVVVQEELTVEA